MKKHTLTIERFLDTELATVGRLRIYNSSGVDRLNGEMYCVEQEWRNNEVGNSCIPRGLYFLNKRKDGRYFRAYNKRWEHPHVYEVGDVPNRSAILIHASSNSEELRGCISPCISFVVRKDGVITTAGTGRDSYTKLFDALVKFKVDSLRVEDVQ